MNFSPQTETKSYLLKRKLKHTQLGLASLFNSKRICLEIKQIVKKLLTMHFAFTFSIFFYFFFFWPKWQEMEVETVLLNAE